MLGVRKQSTIKKKKKKWRRRYSDPDRERLGEQAMINTKI